MTLFNVDLNSARVYPNKAEVYYSFGPFATIAKVKNCPCEDGSRRTIFVTGYADTFFSVPARTTIHQKGKSLSVSGFISFADIGIDEESGPYFIATGKRRYALCGQQLVSAKIAVNLEEVDNPDYEFQKVPYCGIFAGQRYRKNDKFTVWAGAPGTGKTVYRITVIDETGIYGVEIENSVRVEGIPS